MNSAGIAIPFGDSSSQGTGRPRFLAYHYNRRTLMGRRRWMDGEEDFLRSNAGRISAVEVAAALNRGVSAVKIGARRMGLSFRDYQKMAYCKRCGRSVPSHPNSRFRRVCSRCRPAHEKDKTRRHECGPHYQQVLARTGYACEHCGTRNDLCIHHIDGNGHSSPKERQNHHPDNLMVLCRTCHRRLHSHIVGSATLSAWGLKGARAAGWCRDAAAEEVLAQ